ncbi:MAG: FlgD immunoglobulin-like domain containing protein [bacterium]|nr:FlgD immunoglobulin-like domain containing protein [bacterium]
MIGYNAGSNTVEVHTNSASEWLADFLIACVDSYVTDLETYKVLPGPPYSDHASFWDEGYNALCSHEYDFNPEYHTTGDLIITLKNTGTAKAKGVSATLITADPYVTVNVGAGNCVDIEPDSTANLSPLNVWRFGSDGSVTEEGWYIDDIYVGPHTGVELSEYTPSSFAILQNRPNPFTKSSVISYQLPVKCHVSLKIYDCADRFIRTLVDDNKKPGYYSVKWDCYDSSGRRVPSGVYFYRFESNRFNKTMKLLLCRRNL